MSTHFDSQFSSTCMMKVEHFNKICAMNIKMLKKIIKEEGIKDNANVQIKISYRDTDGRLCSKIVDTETYFIVGGNLQLGCYTEFFDENQ